MNYSKGFKDKTNRYSNLKKAHLILLFFLGLTSSAFSQNNRTFEDFTDEDCKCYNRKREGFLSKVDAHCHFRPFGGRVIPFTELISYF